MKNISVWNDIKDNKNFKKIGEDLEVDVLIIGGGITGLSTLYHLKESNLKTILVERNRIGRGVTSRSTAKITYLQEKLYLNIRTLVGLDRAKKYLKSQRYATKLVKDIIEKEKIACDLNQVTSYTFTNEEKNVKKIESEYEFLKNNQVDVKINDTMPLLENIKKAISVDDTYVFHPLKYINGLYNILKENVYEESKVEVIDKLDNYYIVSVNGYKIKTKYVVVATHYPYFLWPYLTPFKSHIETSYLGSKKVKDYYKMSAINIDKPCVSLRFHQDKENNYLIYLFNSYNSASIKSIKHNFDELNNKYHFNYVWSNKDIISNDYIPFIGRFYRNDDTFLAGFGYNTWGMTNGSLAGKILSDIILKKNNEFIELFSFHRGINLSKVIRFPLDVSSSVKAIVKGNENNVNNSKVINKIIDGKKVLVYKDEKGIEHIVYNRCPHMKCGLVFNEVEKTWDCECHGSRFDLDGKCIEGPSNYDISFRK